jgi:tRNA threonylcarbamoyl adenosine modification protein YeaZ
MIHAALDTSLAAAFAIAEDGRLLVEANLDTRGRDSDRLLVPWLLDTVAGLGLSLADIGEWSAGTGPGSFSGIRAGIAWVLGVRTATGAIVRGVPSSLALARAVAAASGERIAVLHDARRGQLILSPYLIGECGPVVAEEARVVSCEELELADYAHFVTAQEAVVELAGGKLGERLRCLPHLEARHLLEASDIPWPGTPAETVASLEPVYVRPAVFVQPRPVAERQG